MSTDIRHNPSLRRFTRELPGDPAFLEYETAPGTLEITHTFVPPAGRGQGIAEALMRAAVAHAQASHLRIIPTCSYAAKYLERNPIAGT